MVSLFRFPPPSLSQLPSSHSVAPSVAHRAFPHTTAPPPPSPLRYLNMRWSTLVFSVTLFYSLSCVNAIPHDADEKRHWLHKRQGLSTSQSLSDPVVSHSSPSGSQSSSVASPTPSTTPKPSSSPSSTSSSSTPILPSSTPQPSPSSSSTSSSSSSSISSSSSSYVSLSYNPIIKLNWHSGLPAVPGPELRRPLPSPTFRTPKVPHPTAASVPLLTFQAIPSLLEEMFRPAPDQEARWSS